MAPGQRILKHVSRVGEQLDSIPSALPSDTDLSHVRSLCLHGNLITRCSGLDALPALTELNLSSNNITTVQGMPPLPQLRILNLASNRLTDMHDFPDLPALTRLSVAHNGLTSLSGLSALESAAAPLEALDLRNNHINHLTELAVLTPVTALRKLKLSGGSHPNGIASIPTLAAAVATSLPQVRARSLPHCPLTLCLLTILHLHHDIVPTFNDARAKRPVAACHASTQLFCSICAVEYDTDLGPRCGCGGLCAAVAHTTLCMQVALLDDAPLRGDGAVAMGHRAAVAHLASFQTTPVSVLGHRGHSGHAGHERSAHSWAGQRPFSPLLGEHAPHAAWAAASGFVAAAAPGCRQDQCPYVAAQRASDAPAPAIASREAENSSARSNQSPDMPRPSSNAAAKERDAQRAPHGLPRPSGNEAAQLPSPGRTRRDIHASRSGNGCGAEQCARPHHGGSTHDGASAARTSADRLHSRHAPHEAAELGSCAERTQHGAAAGADLPGGPANATSSDAHAAGSARGAMTQEEWAAHEVRLAALEATLLSHAAAAEASVAAQRMCVAVRTSHQRFCARWPQTRVTACLS
jgi:Leucine Rich repeat